MRLDWSTLALQLANFAVLVWLLQRVLYRPVLRQIDARRAAIEATRAEAARIKESATAERAALDAARAGIALERSAMLKSAAVEAEAAASACRAQGERDAHTFMEATRKALSEEHERLLDELRESALDLAVQMTQRLLAELPAALRDEPWLERIEQHLTSLSAPERTALLGELASGEVVRVVTAATLPEDRAAAWRQRLCRALERDLTIRFETDPRLIAGAELHLPHSILGMGLRRLIDRLREEGRSRVSPS